MVQGMSSVCMQSSVLFCVVSFFYTLARTMMWCEKAFFHTAGPTSWWMVDGNLLYESLFMKGMCIMLCCLLHIYCLLGSKILVCWFGVKRKSCECDDYWCRLNCLGWKLWISFFEGVALWQHFTYSAEQSYNISSNQLNMFIYYDYSYAYDL